MKYFMSEDRAQGIYWELHYLLHAGWTVTRQPHGFRIGAPPVSESAHLTDIEMRDMAWDIARFLGNAPFVSIKQNEDASYTIEIEREDETRTILTIDAVPNGLPDQRPKADIAGHDKSDLAR